MILRILNRTVLLSMRVQNLDYRMRLDFLDWNFDLLITFLFAFQDNWGVNIVGLCNERFVSVHEGIECRRMNKWHGNDFNQESWKDTFIIWLNTISSTYSLSILLSGIRWKSWIHSHETQKRDNRGRFIQNSTWSVHCKNSFIGTIVILGRLGQMFDCPNIKSVPKTNL